MLQKLFFDRPTLEAGRVVNMSVYSSAVKLLFCTRAMQLCLHATRLLQTTPSVLNGARLTGKLTANLVQAAGV